MAATDNTQMEFNFTIGMGVFFLIYGVQKKMVFFPLNLFMGL